MRKFLQKERGIVNSQQKSAVINTAVIICTSITSVTETTDIAGVEMSGTLFCYFCFIEKLCIE